MFNIRKSVTNYITKETRKESYNNVLENLGERQQVVFTELSQYDSGATAKELAVSLYKQRKVMSKERNSVHPRLNELIADGLVEVIGKKTCQFTNRKVSIYKIK